MSDIESQSVETQREIYTIGYNEGRTRNFQKRSATGDGPGGAGFFSQHLRSGMSLVDCGCGPGGITCGFAEIVAPGAVLGFDVDAGQVAEAQKIEILGSCCEPSPNSTNHSTPKNEHPLNSFVRL